MLDVILNSIFGTVVLAVVFKIAFSSRPENIMPEQSQGRDASGKNPKENEKKEETKQPQGGKCGCSSKGK
uniref:Putative secreted protein n=1 Tax=Panstrongylus lignarius TaxID=156445 RepID=A0A224Y6U0_9HEMI